MRTVIKSTSEISRYTAEIIVETIENKSNAVIAIDSNENLSEVYKNIVEISEEKFIDFSAVKFILINEFSECSVLSREKFLFNSLFERIGVKQDNVIVPTKRNETTLDEVISSFDGIDIAVMQIMNNGAVGFNEPATPFDSYTHCQLLTDSTILFYKELYPSENVPENGYTLGIKTLFLAKKIIMYAIDGSKADIVHKVVYGKTIPYVPASMFQMHASFELCLDNDSASKI